MTDQELNATAYHEAGHAVMAFSLGRPVEKVTIVPGKMQFGGTRLGACKIQKGRTKSTKDWLEDEAIILLAGMVAESHFTGKYCTAGAAQDLRAVERLAESRLGSSFGNQRQFDRLIKRWIDKTHYILEDEIYQKAIRWIAEELIEKSTVSGRAVRHFFNQANRSK
ncbi:cell division protein FtsH [Stieleria marina]|uniref:ATP-dependent zinc metalloprotease FtsH 3 n=1 Tax=Stieleria marina TaxID=1930275 RepID=A0A517NQU5_9BACT|nr:ATP-dependent zinc metalloprotease FtsH 3 [Planctomycetes bacterium K23_9]